MAIKLSTSTRSIANQWYSSYVQGITGYQLSRLQQDNPGLIRPDYSVSSYLKIEGVRFKINSERDLFDLTKMLLVSQVKELNLGLVNGTKQIFDSSSGQLINVPNVEQLNPIPTGADEGVKRKVFEAKILPKIEQHYAKVLNRPGWDEITRNVLRVWWRGSKDSLFEPYKRVAEAVSASALTGLSVEIDVDTAALGVTNLMITPAFFESIFKQDDSITGHVLEILGFSKFLKDALGGDGSIVDPKLTLDTFENRTIPETYAKIVISALEIDEDLTEKDLNNLNQCALVTALIHDEPRFFFRNYIRIHQYKSPLEEGEGGNDRIYPVQIDNYNPSKLINNCVINKKVKNMFNTTDTKTPHNMVKGVFWVFEVGEGEDRVLREAELSTNSTVHRKKVSTIFNSTAQGDEEPSQERSRFAMLDRERDSSYYFLENTKINFDGTNPSTARSDVKVEMTWKLGSLEGLGSTMAILGTADKLDMDTEITIKDLITLPITKKPNASDGPGQFITNQYSPNYSRLRLKVAPYGDSPDNDGRGVHQNDCMILDLAIIDHTINRSSETGETTLTINYRGYFEATLNMPFNDALASPDVLEKRQVRQQKALDNIAESDCDPRLIREALRLEQGLLEKESDSPSAGTILLRMQKRKLIHSYELDKAKLAGGTFGNVLDGRQMYVKKVISNSSPDIEEKDVKTLAELKQDRDLNESGDAEYEGDLPATQRLLTRVAGTFGGIVGMYAADAYIGEVSEDDTKRKEILSKIDKKFFFLGDLMWTLLDCLYKDGSAEHRTALKNLNLRFIIGTMYVPDPKNIGGPPITINPISIPVDLKFFVQWFNATIVNKGMTHYPIGIFIRDLIERMINDVIYDTCFSLLLPDENPPLLRTRTFVSSDIDWFKKNEHGWFDPSSPFGGDPTDILFPKAFVSNKTSNDNTWSHEITSKNYCVIYQQSPSYKRQLAAQDNGYLRDDEYTPTIYYGAKNKNYNFLSDVSFSKTNSPFLREARFFNTNHGGLSLLSNVYDLSFSFKRRKANTMFYPGCIVNFVLVDWGTRWVDEPPWTRSTSGLIVHSLGAVPSNNPDGFQHKRMGQSDPHIEGTMSNIMGMGGYFIVKSVEYNLGQTPGEFEINISTKFLGTDATKVLNRTTEEVKSATEKPACVTIYNTIATRHNELIRENDEGGDPIALIDAPPAQ